MSNIAFLFLPLAFSSLPAVLPFVSPSSQVDIKFIYPYCTNTYSVAHLLCQSFLVHFLWHKSQGLKGPSGTAYGLASGASEAAGCEWPGAAEVLGGWEESGGGQGEAG